ncbi:hypothetical protein L249_7261 [Ophiocordyceps polyrhachis-furcata BCC 54312]|uniref:PSI domain-containing protein n=1 Tax=Ophiocordyceps polyrhachis-furcata BCC 54312 TaxID=1330021 RepID=A0A367LBF0_9HYPO|nr:hypothetical protein L249_7261 [Ophiocordyceps polyrhachis-furcata BCC 54312]
MMMESNLSIHLMRCWSHQDCRGCLNDDECSWCPFTWACVPNACPIPLLAPAYDDRICPHPAERWELRTRPFGCRVSTTTSLTAVVAVLATVLLALVTLLNVVALRRWRRRDDKADWRQHDTWRAVLAGPDSLERQPLLDHHRSQTPTSS